MPQGPSAADLRAERLRVARERQDALRKQMDAEPRAPVVDPEPEAPRAAKSSGYPQMEHRSRSPPRRCASWSSTVCHRRPSERPSRSRSARSPTTRRRPSVRETRRSRAFWPPSARRGSSRSSKRKRSMMLCCRRSSPRTSWTSASRRGLPRDPGAVGRQGEEDRGVGRGDPPRRRDAPERAGGRAPPPPRRN